MKNISDQECRGDNDREKKCILDQILDWNYSMSLSKIWVKCVKIMIIII